MRGAPTEAHAVEPHVGAHPQVVVSVVADCRDLVGGEKGGTEHTAGIPFHMETVEAVEPVVGAYPQVAHGVLADDLCVVDGYLGVAGEGKKRQGAGALCSSGMQRCACSRQ